MDLQLTAAQVEFAEAFSSFCDKVVAPVAKQVDREGQISSEVWGALADMGFFRLHVSEAHGGLGADFVMRGMADEALAGACASTFLSAGASAGLFGGILDRFGGEAQRERFLNPLMVGDLIGCFGLTEASSGSDARAMATIARQSSGGWVLQGEKTLITNAPVADAAVVFARVMDGEADLGVTAFVVELSRAGISRGPRIQTMGCKGSSTGSLRFDEVQLTSDDLLGQVGEGWAVAKETLLRGRVGMAHFGIGLAEAALSRSIRYSTERMAFGKPIARKQAVHFKIADMKIKLDGARLMARRAGWRIETGDPSPSLCAIAKTFATESAVQVTDLAVQVHGGWGFTEEFDIERLYRDARLGPVGEGTNEIMREIIAEALIDEL